MSKIPTNYGDALAIEIAKRLNDRAALQTDTFTNVPAADTDAIVTSIAASATALDLSGDDLDGVIGAGAISPPRPITLTTAGADANFVNNSTVTVTGKDKYGYTLTDTITITTGGSPGTFSTAKAFASVSRLQVAAQGTITDGTMEFGFGAGIGLDHPAAHPLFVHELVDGAVPGSAGALTSSTTAGPNGVYTPHSSVTPNGSRDYTVVYVATGD